MQACMLSWSCLSKIGAVELKHISVQCLESKIGGEVDVFQYRFLSLLSNAGWY